MADRIGYVLIEYNQASRQPNLPVAAEMYDSIEGARYALKVEERDTRLAGRGEIFVAACWEAGANAERMRQEASDD